MTEFQKDLAKILLDKGLLGLIAMAFGFYLSRLLEGYRAKRSYDLHVLQQRVDACRKAAAIIAKHFRHLMGVYDMLELLASKHPETLSDEEAEPGYEYIKNYELMNEELVSLVPLLPAEVGDALGKYIEETSRLTDIIKGKFDRGKPTKDELSLALARFIYVCGAVIAAGPFRQPQIEEL